jgi:hypothetical protein
MTKQKIITTTSNQLILWSMVYLNTIPIRNLSHRIKNGNREKRQPVEPKSVKQHKATEMKLKKICGGQLSCFLQLWCNNWRNLKNFNTTPQYYFCKNFQYFSIKKVDFWNFNLGVRKSLECRIFNHLPQSFWGPWAVPRPPAVVGNSLCVLLDKFLS